MQLENVELYVISCFTLTLIMNNMTAQDVFLICMSLVLLSITLTAGILIFLHFRKKKLDDELHRMLWKIDYREIEFHSKQIAGSRMSRSYMSLKSINPANGFGGLCKVHQLCEPLTIATYKGSTAAVKTYDRPADFSITKQHLVELKQMKDLTHENINTFMGACEQPPHIYILTPLCAKGCLTEILENKEVHLDKLFKNSLISDLAHGMRYLHDSPLQSHGHLASKCCLIDSRWVLKVADYGLQWLRKSIDPETKLRETKNILHEGYLWCAPELLRLPATPERGTQHGDVYSFAIVLQEILFRQPPFFMSQDTPTEIIKKIRQPLTPPYRPQYSSIPAETDHEMISLMKQCWEEDPALRPSFSDVTKTIVKINSGSQINILDNMVEKLEKYANNLEEIVERRTEELVEEKKKTDQLLYKMMPSVVAERLKVGEPVKPELYDFATVYFSDIVGFTAISAMSTPIEIIDLLNDLYTCFDDIIATFDVYKVETIGDAYMCVSGVPNRNGAKHASNIADMALAIREATSTFTIRHMPDTLLMIRIGVHTGPCAAGVVGLTMPRYCLFGDTVNTASRMESNSMAMKIHLSESSNDALTNLGGYRTKLRGEIEVKGKGKVKTYWLIRRLDTVTDFH